MSSASGVPIPRYHHLAMHLEKEYIGNPRYTEEILPSFNDLVARHQVSKFTIDRAIKSLIARGLVHALRGKGVFINKRRQPGSTRSKLSTIVALMDNYGLGENSIDLFQTALLNGMQREAQAHGFAFVRFSVEAALMAKHVLDQRGLLADPGAGYLISSSDPAAAEAASILANHGKPVAFVGQDPVGAIPAANTADTVGVFRAVGRLAALGHKRIALYASGPRHTCTAVRRMAGFKAGLERAGLEADERLVVFGGRHSLDSHRDERVRALFIQGPVPATAVIALNANAALYLYMACLRLGLRVPRDVSIIAFEWSIVEPLAGCRLTSLEYSHDRLGKNALTALITQRSPKPLVLTLVGGESTARPLTSSRAKMPARPKEPPK